MKDLTDPQVTEDRNRAFATGDVLEARIRMVHNLSTALYGDSWARPESPRQVWEELLAEVRRLAERSRP